MKITRVRVMAMSDPVPPELGFSIQPKAMERFKYLPGPEYEW